MPSQSYCNSSAGSERPEQAQLFLCQSKQRRPTDHCDSAQHGSNVKTVAAPPRRLRWLGKRKAAQYAVWRHQKKTHSPLPEPPRNHIIDADRASQSQWRSTQAVVAGTLNGLLSQVFKRKFVCRSLAAGSAGGRQTKANPAGRD